MQKIKDFAAFAAGYFIGLSIRQPTAKDINKHSMDSRDFAAALVFYMSNDISVIAKRTLEEKHEQVARNVRALIGDRS